MTITLTDYQQAAVDQAGQLGDPVRMCLYYKTGAGKTHTSLAILEDAGFKEAVVIAPPSTHKQWIEASERWGITVHCMSHAKFRMKGTKLSRSVAVIADEVHLFGGHKGQGWKKLDTLAKHLQAPLIVMSATPNYNDVERVYCIQHVLDWASAKGGYLEFIYQHCETEANPFGMEPNVIGFRNYKDAADYLSALPNVAYVPDDLVYTIQDFYVPATWPDEAVRFGLNRRAGRIMASQIEERHARVNLGLVDDQGLLRAPAFGAFEQHRTTGVPILVYANHATVAQAVTRRYAVEGVGGVRLVTGSTSKKLKDQYVQDFIDGEASILIGTASLATGTDGLDKVCNSLVILDDTDDDSLRRQLIGRIMPRGIEGGDASMKQVHRLVLQ